MSPGVGIFIGLLGMIGSIFFLTGSVDDNDYGMFKFFLATSILSVILLIMSIIVSATVAVDVKTESDQKIVTTPIISVSNSTSTGGEGSFALGSGSFVIATDEVYRYYYETSEGIKQGKVPASETVIKYTDEAPVLRKITDTTQTTERWWWFYHWEHEPTSSTHYELLIPEGSVINQFNLN